MRVLHAPTDVGNQAWNVSQGERALGVNSEVMIYVQHYAGFGFDYNLHFERRELLSKLWQVLQFGLRASKKYDVIHFYFATTLLPYYLDLPWWKFLKKRMFFTFQGCDIRPASICPAAVRNPEKHRHAPLHVQQKNLQKILSYATHTFVLNPDLLPISPSSSFLPYAVNISNPGLVETNKGTSDTITIFHAPSDPLVKGTAYLEAAVQKLQQEGHSITLDLVSGVSHEEVLKRASSADIVVDQLLGGWYGAFAVEAMALGKPTICYLQPEQMERISWSTSLPLIHAAPDTIESVLRSLIQQKYSWPEISSRSRAFVEQMHSPIAVASETLRRYRL